MRFVFKIVRKVVDGNWGMRCEEMEKWRETEDKQRGRGRIRSI